MNSLVATKRTELRDALERNKRHRIPEATTQRVTDLGMHFIDVDGMPVLVTVEINVPRIVAVLGKRLVTSKSGVAKIANGSVRLRIATAEGRELCVAQKGT